MSMQAGNEGGCIHTTRKGRTRRRDAQDATKMHEPVLHDEEGAIRHALDGKIESPFVVACRNGEASIVGADQVYQPARLTAEMQRKAFARVGRLVVNES